MKLFHKRKCKAALGSTQNLVTNKVGVRSSRFEELLSLQEKLPEQLPYKELTWVAVNFNPAELEELENSGLKPTSTASIGGESWKEAVALFGKPVVDAMLIKLQTDELQEIEKCILALCFMKNCPAVIVASPGTNAAVSAKEFTAHTLPVVSDLQVAVQQLKVNVPRTLLLIESVQQDIATKVECYKKINVVQHFGKRAAVALIPFAVQAVNFAGILRLVKRMMKVTGMTISKQVATTTAKYSAVASLKAAAIDQVGDVYQYAVAATILADVGSALAAEGVSAAMATLDAVDFALLGSVSFVTGTLSAIGAYLTRPQLVDAVSKFLATLQVVYLLNPDMRRPLSDELSEDTDSVDEDSPRRAEDNKDFAASESTVPLLSNNSKASAMIDNLVNNPEPQGATAQ